MEKQNNLLQKDLAFMEHRKMSGVRYVPETEQEEENAGLAKDYMYQNPLHWGIFPSARQMETELLGMIGKELSQEKHNGLVLLDGVEAAIVYLVSLREKNKKEGRETRVAISCSASECLKKAAYLLDVTLVIVPTDKDGRMQLSGLKKVIRRVSGVVANMGSNLFGSVDDV